MKNATSLRLMGTIVSIFFIAQLSAQEFSNKYGRVTDDEINMTVYEADTTANAIMIYKDGTTSYQFINNEFRVVYDVAVKIKVLKSEGTEYANVSIPYYYNEKHTTRKETVTSVDANAYNLVNGKIERTKMKKEYVFKERLSDTYMQLKFSIPSVKVGTVIEYKYKISSDYFYVLKEWDIQQEIPVVQNTYELTIPEYFKFNIDTRGGEHIEAKETPVNQKLLVRYQGGQENIHANARKLTFSSKDIPALKPDGYVWYPEDFKAKVCFELYGLDFPGTGYKSLSETWEAIDKLFLDDEDFGKLLKMRNPLRNEMAALSLDGLSTDEKIVALFTFLKQHISWNKEYALWGKDIRKGIKEGTANNAVLNFIFMSMLREANIPTVPILLSQRNKGILPLMHPSLNKINTFVVGIQNTDSTMVFLDGSVTHGYTNILPPVLLVERARMLSESGSGKWVNLQHSDNNRLRTAMQVNVNDEGQLVCTRNTSYSGQYAASYRSSYKNAKDSLDFIDKKEVDNHIKVTAYSQEDVHAFSPMVRESISFTKTLDATGDYLYINPMVFKHISESPFVQEDRKLPVEFPFRQLVQVSVTIVIPDNYEIDELPQSGGVTLSNPNDGSCRYLVNTVSNMINLNYQFTLNKYLFALNEYALLKEFWETVARKNNEMIVLKRKAE